MVVVTSATLLVKRTIEELQGLMSDRPTPGAEGAAGELAAPLLSQVRGDDGSFIFIHPLMDAHSMPSYADYILGCFLVFLLL